jgi:predicted peroxiredoxin
MLLVHASHGKEDSERATLPFVLANNAALAGEEVVVLLTTEAVWLATEGGAEGVHREGLPPVTEIMGELIENGGQVWACQSCTKPREITDDQLVKGARIGTSMEVVELMARGAASITF